MTAPTKSRAKKSRKPRTMVPYRQRENTSTTCLYPWQVAAEMLCSEDQIYLDMARPVERGGLRSICIGDPTSRRPRRVVHVEDFKTWMEYKRGLIGLAEYAKRAGAGK